MVRRTSPPHLLYEWAVLAGKNPTFVLETRVSTDLGYRLCAMDPVVLSGPCEDLCPTSAHSETKKSFFTLYNRDVVMDSFMTLVPKL